MNCKICSKNIKRTLNADTMRGFISAVVSELTNEEIVNEYYVYKNTVINQYTLATYLDEKSIDALDAEKEIDVYEILDIIKDNINMNQYADILASIDEGLQYELSKRTANNLFADMNQSGNEDMLKQLDEAIEKVGGQEKFAKLVDLATQTDIQQKARDEVKAEMIANKK